MQKYLISLSANTVLMAVDESLGPVTFNLDPDHAIIETAMAREDITDPLSLLVVAPRTTVSRLEFLSRFSSEEVVFLWAQPVFAPFVARVLAAEVVDLGDATAQEARQLLAQALDAQGVRIFPDARLDAIFGTEA